MEELTEVIASEELARDHLITSATISCSTQSGKDIMLGVIPIGHAPLLLVAPDGRVSHFPRSWAEVETQDGRKGVGWIEWNLNQRH